MLLNEKAWLPFLPEFRILQPLENVAPKQDSPLPSTESLTSSLQDMAEKKCLAFAAFRAELPPSFLPHVERFPSHQWPLLVLLHGSPKSIDLAASTPVLAWCLANNHYFRERQAKTSGLLAVIHSHQKQRDILEWLGFPGTDSVVRLMRKIQPEAAAPTLLSGLRLVLQSKDFIPDGFNHLKSINAGILALVSQPAFFPLLSPSLLEEVSESAGETEYPQVASRLMDILTIYKAAETACPSHPLRSIAQTEALLLEAEQSYQAHLQRVAEEARLQAARLRDARRLAVTQRERERRHQQAVLRALKTGKASFPVPPIPGTESIVPLTNSDELTKESREQVNCVRTYAYHVAEGHTYIYRILAPERATLSIVRRPDGSWHRSECHRALKLPT